MDRNPSIWRGAGIFALAFSRWASCFGWLGIFFVFCDEYNFSPEAACGSGLDLGLLWLRLFDGAAPASGRAGPAVPVAPGSGGDGTQRGQPGDLLRLLGTLLLFCHRQGMAPALACGSALHWGLLWVQLIAALALLLCSLCPQFPRRVSKASP